MIHWRLKIVSDDHRVKFGGHCWRLAHVMLKRSEAYRNEATVNILTMSNNTGYYIKFTDKIIIHNVSLQGIMIIL